MSDDEIDCALSDFVLADAADVVHDAGVASAVAIDTRRSAARHALDTGYLSLAPRRPRRRTSPVQLLVAGDAALASQDRPHEIPSNRLASAPATDPRNGRRLR